MSHQSAKDPQNLQFLQALNKYIPSLVLQQLVNKIGQGERKLPELQSMNTAVLFADISGFTALGEACAKKGVRGNEELAFCINRYMEGLVKNLGKYGGDIIKFVGDALIVMWPEERSNQADKHSFIIRKAIQCALDIQKEMNNFLVLNEVSPLSVKIGIGYGECALLYVGGVFNRAEFFTVGSALTYALKSEGEATEGGQIIVSETAYKYVREFYQSREIISDKGEKFYHVELLTGQGVKSKSEALAIRAGITDETYIKIQNSLRGCVPAAIIPYLQIGAEKFGSETRSLTVMFASLGVELSSAETRAGMEKIQKIFVCVQEQVYRHQGSLNKLVMDDKGSTLICLWGLSPMAHDDDAARAILTAFNIRRELKKIDGTTCNIGISSGEMFVGVVGTSGSRKEFSVLGDVANLAARIMYWPIKNKEVGKVNVDLNSRNLAANHFSFKYGGHQEFKGKSISIPIFEPIEPSEEQKDITKELLSPGVFLKPHTNPLTVSMHSAGFSDKQKITGLAADGVKSLKSEIITYFSQLMRTPYMASVKGELGSGKTLFIRSLLAELYESDDLKRMMQPKNKFFCSSLNQETQYNFLNIWRPILTQLLTWVCKKDKVKREQVLQSLLCDAAGGVQANSKYALILCQIFSVNDMLLYSYINSTPAQQVHPDHRQNPFVQRETYADKENIIRLCLHFLKSLGLQKPTQVIGQQPQLLVPDQNPILLVLDNTHLMDGPSWQLFAAVRDECTRIGVILVQLCDTAGELIIAPEARQDFNLVWFAKNMDKLRQYELPSLSASSLESLLLSHASQYRELSLAQVKEITDIKDETKTIKKKEKCLEWKELFIEQWQLVVEYKSIAPVIIDIILKQCAGNPLLSLNLFVSLLQNKFIFIKQNGQVVPLKKFSECQSLGEYLDVPVPRIAIKQNLAMIDKFLSSISFKPKKRPEELENCVKSIVLMKAASVIGDQFDMKALIAVNPLRQSESVRTIKTLVKLLESHGFIEIVNDSDPDNLVCRFSKPFLRESIYQVTLFRDQKINIHGATAQFLLKNQTAVNLLNEGLLKRHLLASEDTTDEDKLSLKSRTGLQITRIQNILENDPKALVLNEFIYKQGDKVNKKTSKRLATVDTHYLKWYHNQKELEQFTPLGRIPIIQIYETVNAKLQWLTRPSFSIKTTMWFDKQDQEQGSRQFFFAGDSTIQIEKWMITIDYLHTKAIYDQYAQQSQSITFLSLKPKNERQKPEATERDKQSLLYDFGKQFLKQTVTEQQPLGTSRRPSQRLEQTGGVGTNELANKLKTLYGCGMASFLHHLTRTAAKVTVSQQNAHLGQLPDKAAAQVKEKVEQVISEDLYHSVSDKLTVRSQDLIETRRKIRRESTISADQVSKAKELSRKYKKESESSPMSQNNPPPAKIVQSKVEATRRKSVNVGQVPSPLPQTFQQHQSQDFALGKRSVHTTPQLSITQTVIEHKIDENRQTFAPSEDLLALFNQDERLDHLRSQSPPIHNPRVTHEKHTSFTDSKKQSETSGASDNHNNSLLLNSLQKFIQKSIADGVQTLVHQNEKNLKSQKEELSNVIAQTHSQLLSGYESPQSRQQSRHSFMDQSVRSGGVTSQRPGQRGLDSQKPLSKNTPLKDSDDLDEPNDPVSRSPDQFRGQKRSVDSSKLDAQSERTLKRGEYKSPKVRASAYDQYEQYEQPTRSVDTSIKAIAQCLNDSTCQKDRTFRIKTGQFVEVTEKLPSNKLYKIESQGRQGIFLMGDFRLIDNVQAQPPPRIQMANQRILQDEQAQIKMQNLKMLERLKQKKRRQMC